MRFTPSSSSILFLIIGLLMNPTIEALSLSPYRTIMKKVAALSTVFLLSGSSIAVADNSRTVGEITTSGIIFKDTLKITGAALFNSSTLHWGESTTTWYVITWIVIVSAMIFMLFLLVDSNSFLFRVAVSVQISYQNRHITWWYSIVRILLHIFTSSLPLLTHHQISGKVNIIISYFSYFFSF